MVPPAGTPLRRRSCIMSIRKLLKMFLDLKRRRRPARRASLIELNVIERLDRRVMPVVSATFSATQGVLTVFGDARDNTIEVSRNVAGAIQINGGGVTIRG